MDIEGYWPTFEALVPARDLYKVAINDSKAAARRRKKDREAQEAQEARARRAQETVASQQSSSSNGAGSR